MSESKRKVFTGAQKAKVALAAKDHQRDCTGIRCTSNASESMEKGING